MPLYRFLGGPQSPDQLGYVEPGEIRELGALPSVGRWEPVAAASPITQQQDEEG